MDEKGFGYTFDAVLALIPIMIVICGVSNLPTFNEPSNYAYSSQQAQDVMDFMAQYRPNGGMSVLETLSTTLESGNNNQASIQYAGEIFSNILSKNFPKMEYILTEENQLGGEILAGKLDIENENNVATASRNCGNHTYRIYVK
ncbi:MAG TPA: hypothetical protein GX531_02740 [Methanothermobacter sp.]|nr:hypothetical protein [Methanothermobacter sp.]